MSDTPAVPPDAGIDPERWHGPDLVSALSHAFNHVRADVALDVDAVELIEAAPGSRKRQTSGVQLAAAKRRPGMPDMAFEELSHHDVVHLWRAIEHHALLRQCLLLLSIT